MKQYTPSLATYSDVRKMNFEEFSKWAVKLYQRAYEEGRAAVTAPEALIGAFRETLKAVDDIGPIRAEAIIKKFSSILGVIRK